MEAWVFIKYWLYSKKYCLSVLPTETRLGILHTIKLDSESDDAGTRDVKLPCKILLVLHGMSQIWATAGPWS